MGEANDNVPSARFSGKEMFKWFKDALDLDQKEVEIF